MKRRSLLAGAALCLVAAGARAAGALTPWTGSPAAAPAIDLFTADGAPFSLASLRGKVVLVNFWASWCEPCVAEMPSLQRLRDQCLGRLEVLGVNYQEGPARIKAFLGKVGIVFPVVRDTDGAVARAWEARIFPSTFVVDREGRVQASLVGEADWTSLSLVRKIEPLL